MNDTVSHSLIQPDRNNFSKKMQNKNIPEINKLNSTQISFHSSSSLDPVDLFLI
jgi:hypothetical protein